MLTLFKALKKREERKYARKVKKANAKKVPEEKENAIITKFFNAEVNLCKRVIYDICSMRGTMNYVLIITI